MEAKDYILTKFINDKSMTFLVPPYQRKYKWRKKEIEELINDIEEFQDNTDLDSYFLGSIVVKKNNKLNTRYTLVDGQQRITTLFLMCSAFYDILKSINKEKSTLGVRIYTILESDENKFKLIRINDENIVKKIMKGTSYILTDEEKKSNYFNVYERFKKYFQTVIEKKEEEEIKEENWKKLEKFFHYGISKIKVAIINLEPKEDEFLVFESINSKGKSLSSVDLIKNYVMMSLFENKLESLQSLFENNFVDKITENDLGNLYRQTLAIEKGALYSLNSKNLYYEFKKLFPKQKINKAFINKLLYDLAIFKDIKKRSWGNKENKSLPLLKSQLMNFYSIIHLTVRENSYFENNRLKITNQKNIEYVVNYLSRLVVARILCSFGRVEGNRTYAKLSNKLKNELVKSDFKNSFDKIIINDLETSTGRYRMPTKDEIKKETIKGNIYINKSILKWILIALEQNMTEKKLDDGDNFTIEHIYPQNPNPVWNKKITEKERTRMDSIVHTLGNLSITHKNTNPRLSNKSDDEKKQILADHSYLKINKMFYVENLWNYDAIERRAKKLLEMIFRLWWN